MWGNRKYHDGGLSGRGHDDYQSMQLEPEMLTPKLPEQIGCSDQRAGLDTIQIDGVRRFGRRSFIV